LQEREFERVGGNRTIKVDVRVIATTNRQLQESVERKEFREDLFFRLNVVPIVLPPLKERKEDIPLLATQFLQRFARKHGVHVMEISAPCMSALLSHDWPGNVRELQNVIERAVIMCSDGDSIRTEHLGLTANSEAVGVEWTGGNGAHTAAVIADLESPGEIPTLRELEKKLIFAALKRCNDNRTHAAKMIGISLRTLRNKLSEYRSEGQLPTSREPAEGAKLVA
jgi:DNA-binding NtrC family response regulator